MTEKKKLFLNGTHLLKKEELEIVEVDLGEGVFVHVRQMTGHERENFERMLYTIGTDKKGEVTTEKHLEDFRAKLVVCTVCDENGKFLLRSKDYVQLSRNMSAFRLEKIVNVAQRLNAITETDKDAIIKN
ncbi:unnamed protein product [marine sediment metagenome]|uniref:Uncharacterized protein n=1 Tax=marine sediment metagenome TaxID=412755 RepID=X1G876_9ZZZZ